MRYNEISHKMFLEYARISGMAKFKLKDYKCSCGCDEFYAMASQVGKNTYQPIVHKGIYCSMCGTWRKWLNAEEIGIMWKIAKEEYCGKCLRADDIFTPKGCAKQHCCHNSPTILDEFLLNGEI